MNLNVPTRHFRYGLKSLSDHLCNYVHVLYWSLKNMGHTKMTFRLQQESNALMCSICISGANITIYKIEKASSVTLKSSHSQYTV